MQILFIVLPIVLSVTAASGVTSEMRDCVYGSGGGSIWPRGQLEYHMTKEATSLTLYTSLYIKLKV